MSLVDPWLIRKMNALREISKETPNYRNVIVDMVLRELKGNSLQGYFVPCLKVAEELLGDNLYIEDDDTFARIEDKEQWTWEYVDRLIEYLYHKFSEALVLHSIEVQTYVRRHFRGTTTSTEFPTPLCPLININVKY